VSAANEPPRSASGRRPPPPFRQVKLRTKQHLSSRMVRVTVGGQALSGLEIAEPAASVRLLLPSPGSTELVIPEWNGNEFLLSDGSRPIIRTFTPRFLDRDALELTLDLVLHDGGVASEWVVSAKPGAPAAVSGPGRGYEIDPQAPEFLLAGDETALPAISQLLERIPADIPVRVLIEIADRAAGMDLPDHPRSEVSWHELPGRGVPGDALVAAVEAAEIGEGCLIWCAGEAAAMHRIRTHLFKQRGLPRSVATVRGYWKRPSG